MGTWVCPTRHDAAIPGIKLSQQVQFRTFIQKYTAVVSFTIGETRFSVSEIQRYECTRDAKDTLDNGGKEIKEMKEWESMKEERNDDGTYKEVA
jgi:hypothetical protein